jgi:hypothetical protein
MSAIVSSNPNALQPPKHIISLASAAILVDVDVNVWTATKQNRTVSTEVTTLKKASRDSGRFIENLLANDPDHKRILNYRQTIYNWLQRRAFDFAGSQRILPQIDIPVFKTEFDSHNDTFYQLVNAFLDKYPTIVSNMAFVQGDMFDRNNYPDVEQIRNKFNINLYTFSVPVNDWRCQISNDLAEDFHRNYSRQAKTIIDNILVKQTEQIVNVLTSLAHCCGVDETTGADGTVKTKKRKIYDTTIEKAIGLCNTFRDFNLTDSKPLEDCRAALEKVIKGVDKEMLRENDVVREQVKDDLDDILSKFKPLTHLNTTAV